MAMYGALALGANMNEQKETDPKEPVEELIGHAHCPSCNQYLRIYKLLDTPHAEVAQTPGEKPDELL